ncbi:MAG: isochorismatase family cysteine hydrolase [Methanomethylophilus sp.]|nr:cysteine hydrolase [Methanomethylophilus sp.]MDD4221867.1 cysteine hydrolase [Methanomethylophilus sp.]MDD4668400.1 cysteine hydrolase [Methanomethylophilus sp.]
MMVTNLYDKNLAFVIIDAQRKFMINHQNKTAEYDQPLTVINRTAEMFRKARRPVIFVKFIGGKMCHPYHGTDGDELFQGLKTDPSDITVIKHYMNSFQKTDLAEVIRSHGCNAAVYGGTVTQYCVMSTYYSSFDYEITPYLVGGGCIATAPEVNDAAEVICKALSQETLKGYFDGDPKVVGKPDSSSSLH